jgi:glutaryl-CoA dehydrogenase
LLRTFVAYFKNPLMMRADLYEHPDYYLMDELLTEEHKMVREATREWVKRDVTPIIEDYAQRAEFPRHLVKGLAEVGAFGPYIPAEYGGAGLDQISYGLMMMEIERGDSGIRSTCSVQSSLVMYPIYAFGNEEQRRKYLPKLANGEWLGSFGLTEPNFGSNPGGMVTNYKDMGDHYLLNGAKLWISNSPFCDVAVVWAKDESGRIHGLIVERGMEGFTTPETHNKWSLRASSTGELVFDNVKVPKENLLTWRSDELPGFRALWYCLGCAWCSHGLLRYRPALQQGAHSV